MSVSDHLLIVIKQGRPTAEGTDLGTPLPFDLKMPGLGNTG